MSRKSLIRGSLTALGLATAAGLVLMPSAAPARPSTGEAANPAYENLPLSLTLTGVVRDFKGKSETGGHPDMEAVPTGGYGHYMGNIASSLDSDKKPVFQGGGKKVSAQWRDSAGRNIHPSLFQKDKGDVAGSYTGNADSGGIKNADSFKQWYRTIPGVNMAKDLSITLNRAAGSNLYVFDDREDPVYSTRGGFFPINNDMFGNFGNYGKNFHFTFELATEFIYEPGTGQMFKFIGDDDVWVFINDQLVIDLGGVHSAVNQTVLLDRLTNLIPNKKNSLRVFHAERHTTQSNFRIETTINLKSAELPNTSKLYD